MSRSLVLGAVVAVLVGCAGATKGLVKRAEFDLQCPARDLRFTKIDDDTHGVTGCGKRAIYLEVCDVSGWGPINCRLVNNSQESVAATPPAPVQPAATSSAVPAAPPPPP